MMEIDKVISQLKDLIKDRRTHVNDDEDIEWNEIWLRDIKALNQAIDALNKTIKKKPVKAEDGDIRCPRCSCCFYVKGFDKIYKIYKDNYCRYCGQAIDWSNSNEL